MLNPKHPAYLLKALPHLDKVLAASYCQAVLYLAFCHRKYRNMVSSPLFPNFACSTTERDIHWFSVVSSFLPMRLIPFCVDQNSTAVLCIIVPAPRHAATLCLLSTFLGYILKHQQENRLVSIHALNMNS